MDDPHPAELRIPVRPQRWLFVLNLFVQPAVCALFVLVAMHADGWEAVFGGVMALVTLILFGFAVLVLIRTWGKTFELVVGDTVEVPSLLTGRVRRVPLAAIRGGRIEETRARGVSFYALRLELAEGESPRSIVVNSQLVGPAAYDRFCAALSARGVPLG